MSLFAGLKARIRSQSRAYLKTLFSQATRTKLKRFQAQARKTASPLLLMIYGRFTTAELISELAKNVPADFEILMVHSAFEPLLPSYQGAPRDLVRGLVDFCGPERTLVMPSFILGGRDYDIEQFYRSKPFDVRRTPSEVGMIAELFRRYPGAVRSLHPSCAVCAMGPLAKELVANHEIAKTGIGPDSPFGFMNGRKTTIVGIGIEYFRCLTHVHTAAQYMGDEFRIKSGSKAIEIPVIDNNGNTTTCKVGLPDRNRKLHLDRLRTILDKEELREWYFHGAPMFAIPEARVVTYKLIEAARKGVTIYEVASDHDRN